MATSIHLCIHLEDEELAKEFYNRIAADYDRDWSGIYRDTRSLSISQIAGYCNGKLIDAALDLAVGTGNSFLDLEHHIHINSKTGNDISSEMLRQASDKLNGSVNLICDDARNILNHLPPDSQDLVLCHYLFSYLDIHEILDKIFQLLRPGGIVSMATTTKRNLLELSTGRFSFTGKLFRVGNHLKQVDTPDDHDACLKILAEHGFNVLSENNYRKQVVFNSFADVTAWSVDSGWAAQYFEGGYRAKVLLGRAIFAGAAILMYPLYPIYAHSDISVVLARR